MKQVYLFAFLYLFIQPIYSQYQIGIIPRVSPDRMVYQKIGYTEIEISYGSPYVNDRQVWGDLVPYDQIWRAGANTATTVAVSAPINIAGMPLDSGIYSFFVEPKENDKWTIILNSNYKQWGAFKHDATEDVLRFDIEPKLRKTKSESLAYAIKQSDFKTGSMHLFWDFLEIEIPIETNYLVAFEKEIETRASTQPDYVQWIPYIQGAEHLEQINEKQEVAERWINKAEGIMNATTKWNKQFYKRPYIEGHFYWTKAKVLAWGGNYSLAIEYVERLKKMEQPDYYDKQNDYLEIDAICKTWKEKVE